LMIRPFNVANVNPLPQQSPDMGLNLSQFALQLRVHPVENASP
jgi:hypothetical protein